MNNKVAISVLLAALLVALSGIAAAQDVSTILLRCIDSSSVRGNTQRAEIYKAKICTKVFADDFGPRYSACTSMMDLLSQGNAEDAIFEAVQVTGLNDSERFLLLARISLLRVDFAGAVDYYQNTLDQDGNSVFAHILEFAEVSQIIGDLSQSLSLADLALSKAGSNAEIQRAKLCQSVANLSLGNDSLAWAQAEAAERIKAKGAPKWIRPFTYMHKGMIMASLNRLDSAIYFYDKALQGYEKIKGSFIPQGIILLDKAKILVANERYAESEECLKSALELTSQYYSDIDSRITSAAIYLQWAGVLKMIGDYKEAREKLSLSMEQVTSIVSKNHCYDTDLAELEAFQAELEIDMKDFRKAESLCQEALSIYCDPKYENSPSIMASKASLLNTYGNLLSQTYHYTNAKKKYSEALETYQVLQRQTGKPFDKERGFVLNNMGSMFDNMGKFDEAMSSYKTAARSFEKAIATNKSILPTYSRTLTGIGNLYRRYDRADSAMKYLLLAHSLFDGKRSLTDPEKVELSTICNNLAILYKGKEDYDKAETYYSSCYSLRKILAEKDDIYQPLLADILNNYGLYYIDINELDLAVFYLEKALDIRKAQIPEGTSAEVNVLADTYDNLAYAHLRNDDIDLAIDNYEMSRNIRRASAYANPQYVYDYCTTLYNLATIYRNLQKNVDALNALQEIKEAYNDLVDNFSESNYAEIANIDNNIALTYSTLKNPMQAYQMMETVLMEYTALTNMSGEKYLPEVAESYNQLANFASDLGELVLAENYYKKSIEISSELAEKELISYHLSASALNNLGLLYYNQGNTKAATDCFRKARKLFETIPEKSYSIETILSLAMANINLVQCYIFDKNSGKSNIAYDTCQELLSKTRDMLSPYLYNSSANYYYEYAQKLSDNLTK